jgi:hypothetical protein
MKNGNFTIFISKQVLLINGQSIGSVNLNQKFSSTIKMFQ